MTRLSICISALLLAAAISIATAQPASAFPKCTTCATGHQACLMWCRDHTDTRDAEAKCFVMCELEGRPAPPKSRS